MHRRSGSVPSGEKGISVDEKRSTSYQWNEECHVAKRAQPGREDHLERQETADELRKRIQVLFKLKNIPDDKTVKMLLIRLEKYKRTGYV